MSATADLETYEGQVARLDTEYILQAGRAIREQLDAGLAVGLSFAPGNGTAYDLVFIPIWEIQQVGEGLKATDQRSVPVGVFDGSGDVHPGWTLVSKCNGTPSDFGYPFDLRPGQVAHAGYVTSHTTRNFADGCALTALFRAITGVAIL